jgi:tRNA threonylcarbamoyladenosine biosynthesis protein TsaB
VSTLDPRAADPMRVLGIDTSTEVAATGVVSEGVVLADVVGVSGENHSACLADLTARVLDDARLRIDDIDGIAVSVGPGSFTGLRVGLSFAKGIAFSNRCRLVGISTLEALAWLAPGKNSMIAAALDARRGEAYLAIFRRNGTRLERVTEDLALAPQAAVERVLREVRSTETCAVVGNAAERYPTAFEQLRGRGVCVVPLREIHPRGSVVASLGEKRLRAGDGDDIDKIVPTYVRASAAERNLDRLTLTTEKSVS